MTQPVAYSLRDLREKLTGYRAPMAARVAGISTERLAQLEEDASSLTVREAAALADIYGLDADQLSTVPITLASGDAIGVLALQDEFQDLGDEVRLRVVRAANAARSLNALRTRDAQRPRGGQLKRLALEKGVASFRQGALHAQEVRRTSGLATGPIESMRDFVTEHFPSVTVLYEALSTEGPAGLAFGGVVRGPTVVLNLDGKNTNPCVRRFSLAHELYHLLVDWNRREPLATLSGFLTDSGLEREQRANGFAARLLCPESRIRKIKPTSTFAEIRETIAPYGLHYAALRLCLKKEGGVSLPPVPPAELVGVGTEPVWQRAEEPEGIEGFPLADVAPERRTHLARLAAHMFASGKISRHAFAEALDVSPMLDLEAVLSFFALDRPSIPS